MYSTSVNQLAFARSLRAACLASAGLVSLCAMPAWAQTVPPTADPATAGPQTEPQVAPEEQTGGVDDIVVTARRDAENSQRVPVSVQVVTGNALQKLAITSVEEVSKLAPGLTLVSNGSNTAVTLRGVTWQPGSGTPATPIYFNEVPFDPANTITSLYDIGQIEVLRGPQGTTRGAPSISGAVTLTTRKPDLEEFGGYVQGLYGSGDHRDIQGAVNVPIVKGLLAVRLAGNVERMDGNRIYSVNSNIQPLFRDRSYRATVLITPTDTLSIQGVYQRRRTLSRLYTQVAGTGSPGSAGTPGVSPAIRANFNGPVLSTDDNASVQDVPGYNFQKIDLLTVNASWQVFGHTLSYNYGRQLNRNSIAINSTDVLNIVPGFEQTTIVTNPTAPKFTTHEIRVSSIRNDSRPFDYDLGWFSKHSDGPINFAAPNALAGAFGNPATTSPGVNSLTTPNSRYILNSSTNIQIGQVFDSFYGNVRFHIDEKTELSGGLSIIRDRVPVSLQIQTFAAAQNLGSLDILRLSFPAAVRPAVTSCEVFAAFARNPSITTSPTYPGTCDFNIPTGFRNSSQSNNEKYSSAIYNFSLSRQITDDLLVYGTTGSSFRTGLPAINNPGLPSALVTPQPETAKSYELGVKTNFGRRLRINVAAFQLDYKDQLTAFEGIQYFNTVTQAAAQTSLAFYTNIDARVRGFEVEIAAKPFDQLSLGANLSYSKIKSRGGSVPCTDAARPVSATNPINFCPSLKGQTLNQQAPFQATVNGGYELPVTDALSGYLRFNVSYQGKNPNFGNFRTGSALAPTFRKTSAYTVADFFAGITSSNGAYDLGFYAKNAFDKQAELNRVATINSIYAPFNAAPGYDVVRTSRPRELGVQLRLAFGSR